jgi:parallel beta-helix repeat protein
MTGSVLHPGDLAGTAPGAGVGANRVTGIPATYRVDRVIDEAGLGAYLLATDVDTGARAFIKTETDVDALKREAHVLGRIRHPSVARLRFCGTGPAGACLILDLIDGPDLETLLRRRPTPLDREEIEGLLVRLADAVGAIHDAGFLHRDLKPANVVMAPGFLPVVVDLGAAAPNPMGPSRNGPSLVTDGYAAPEQYLEDGREGPWTDVYGLGAIAFRALVGRPLPAAIHRLKEESFEGDLAPFARDRPARRLVEAIRRAVALEPKARLQSPAALVLAIASTSRTAVAAGPQPPAAPEPDPYPPTRPLSRVSRPTSGRVPPPSTPAQTPGGPRKRPGRWRPFVLVAGIVGALGALAGGLMFSQAFKQTWVVDTAGGGDARTIGEGIGQAREGGTILVRPGTYAESVVLDKRLIVRADTGDDQPVIAPSRGSCLTVTAAGATIAGFTFRGSIPADAAAPADACIVLTTAGVILEQNRIEGGTGAAVLIRDGGDPLVQANLIGPAKGSGVVVTAGARGQVVGNTFSQVTLPSIVARGGAEPLIADNTIEDGGGVVFAEGARGTCSSNTIKGTKASAIEVTSGADPQILRNRIEAPAGAGIFVYDRGRGRIEGNTVIQAKLSAIAVEGEGGPTILNNTLAQSGEHGLIIVEGQGAVIEGNTIRNNRGKGIVIGAEAVVELGRNSLEGNDSPQLVDLRRR